MKRAQGLPITTIIIAAIGLIVLVVMVTVFSGQIQRFGRAANECPGRCYKLNPPPEAAGLNIYSDEPCNPNFESEISASSLPRKMPSVKNPTQWLCTECCILTGG